MAIDRAGLDRARADRIMRSVFWSRAALDRVCRFVSKKRGVSVDKARADLKRAIAAGVFRRVMIAGKAAYYCDPATVPRETLKRLFDAGNIFVLSDVAPQSPTREGSHSEG